MRKISDLHPDLQTKVAELKAKCKSENLKIGIGECLRTVEEQNALYAIGRTEEGKIVTNAKGSSYSSMHQWGVAFDFYRNDGRGAFENSDGFFVKIGEIGKEIGLLWGGDFKTFIDLPHFQLPDWGKTPTRLKRLFGKPEAFFESWEDDAMTAEEKKEFESLKKRVEELENNAEKIYRYTADVPDWGRQTIQKLLDKGIYKGESESDLNLPESLLRTLVINDRAGIYDNIR